MEEGSASRNPMSSTCCAACPASVTAGSGNLDREFGLVRSAAHTNVSVPRRTQPHTNAIRFVDYSVSFPPTWLCVLCALLWLPSFECLSRFAIRVHPRPPAPIAAPGRGRRSAGRGTPCLSSHNTPSARTADATTSRRVRFRRPLPRNRARVSPSISRYAPSSGVTDTRSTIVGLMFIRYPGSSRRTK